LPKKFVLIKKHVKETSISGYATNLFHLRFLSISSELNKIPFDLNSTKFENRGYEGKFNN